MREADGDSTQLELKGVNETLIGGDDHARRHMPCTDVDDNIKISWLLSAAMSSV